MLPGREVAAAFPQSGTAIGAAGPAREFQVTVVWLPISIEAVSDVTAADDRQRRTG
jgi:hypothetical protein